MSWSASARLRSNTLGAFQQELRPVGVGGLVDGFRPGVGALEQQAVLEAAVERWPAASGRCCASGHPTPAWSVVRPNSAKSGRPSSPEPGICDALMSRNAKPLTDADPTYPIDATISPGSLRSTIRFHDWM